MDFASRNHVTVTGNPQGPSVVPARGSGRDQNDHRVMTFDSVGSDMVFEG